MPDFDVKLLKKIAIIIVAVLCIILFIVGKLTIPEKEKEEVIIEAANNGERIVHYDGNIYCAVKTKENEKINNVIIRLPLEFDDSTQREVIKTLSTVSENVKLNFFENKLIYNSPNTYIYDLQKNKEMLFCEGELQFMIEPNGYVMLQNGDLYKATYYPTTYMANALEKIAIGDFVKQGEDEEKVYYSSVTGQSNTIIVSLDKETLGVTTLDNINTRKQKIEQIQVTDDYVYAFISSNSGCNIRRISKKVDKEGNAVVEEIPLDKFDKFEKIDTQYVKPLDSKKNKKKDRFNDLYFYGSKLVEAGERYGIDDQFDTKMYKYSFADNTVSEYTGVLNELYTGSYLGDFNGTIAQLYYGDTKITEIDTGIQNLNDIVITDIEIVSDGKTNYLYYEIRVSEIDSFIEETTKEETKIVKNSDIILARTLLEGGPSQRINN